MTQKRNPIRYFKSSPEFIRLVVLLYRLDTMADAHFARALDVLAVGLRTYPDDRELPHATRHLAQEWAKAHDYEDGHQAFRAVVFAMPEVEGLDEMFEAFVRRHVRTGLGGADLEAALGDMRQADCRARDGIKARGYEA